MFAASLLVVAVVATYASLAVISLTGASSGFSIVDLPGKVANAVVPWQEPSAREVIGVNTPSHSVQSVPFADTSLINFGPLPTLGQPRQISVTNTSTAALPLHLTVNDAAGITAQFDTTGSTHMVVHPRQAARINLSSNPMYAGPISGSLTVSIDGSSTHALTIPLTGSQAPYPSPSLTATPATNGAVNLAWTPSPSSGVVAYLVQRSAGSTGAWQNLATYPANATSAVDQTGADGSFTYRVIAEAQATSGGAADLPAPAGPAVTAVADKSAPERPDDVGSPPFINRAQANGGAVQLPVDLAPGSSPSDVITVTLTDDTGQSVSGQAHGGGSSVTVTVPNVGVLADGTITVSATASDSLGNTSKPFTGAPSIWKDTVLPAQPTVSVEGDITSANEDAYPVTVQTEAAAADGATVTATITDGEDNTASQQENEAPGATSIPINVNASKLDDGSELTVTAQVKDEAGNVSPWSAPVPVVKDTTGPTAPVSFGIAAGPDNPAGVVTAQSASAVIVQATFAQPPDVTDTIRVWVNHQPYTLTPDGDSATLTIEPPLDLTGLPDGTYKIGMKQTDADGNETPTWSHFTVDTGGAEAPTGVGVPAGPDNPAGYVNAATQTAATIVATFAGPTDPADQISLTVGGMQLSTQSGGSDQLSWTADLSGLPDGKLPITGTIIDGNGVKSSFTGSLIKDTQAPPAPAVASVIGPPANTITPSSASCVKVFVAFNQAPDPNDAVTVTLSDGSSSAQGSATAGDGHVIVGCIDASSLSAGQISVNVTVTDAAGNSTDFTGTPAVLLTCQHGGQGNGGSQSPDQ